MPRVHWRSALEEGRRRAAAHLRPPLAPPSLALFSPSSRGAASPPLLGVSVSSSCCNVGLTDPTSHSRRRRYNAVNGVPSCANGALLNDVMRRQWAREDAVITTDSGAVGNLRGAPAYAPSDAAAAAWALNNGTDINDGHAFPALPEAVRQGLADEVTVDRALRRALTQLFAAGLFEPNVSAVSWTGVPASVINSTAHQAANLDAARQSFVLLANDGSLLPLQAPQHVAVIGPQAEGRASLLSDYASEQPCADGTDTCIVSVADAVRREVLASAGVVTTAAGVDIDSNRTDGMEEALSLAQAADVVILALGIDKSVEGEGHDRPSSRLPGQQEAFATQVLALGKPTVVVLVNGGALAIDALLEVDRRGAAMAAVPPFALVEAFNPNTIGATALAELLFGRINSWSKLPYTIYPAAFDGLVRTDNFAMSAGVGRTYRYWSGPAPLFPFGFGLSYTPFALNCQAPYAEVVHLPATFECVVTNVGRREGDEVVLLYHQPTDEVRRMADHALPLRRLVGFERVSVAPGAKAASTVWFHVTQDMLALATAAGGSRVYPGRHELRFSRGHGEDALFQVTTI